MSVATVTAADAQRRLYLDLVTIDALTGFAGGAPLPVQVDDRLRTVSGRSTDDPDVIVAVQRWMTHYAHPIELLRRFRDGLLAGIPVEDKQLADVARTADDIVEAVDVRLARLR